MQGAQFVNAFLAFLANPTVAYLLLVFGLLALVAELSAPGVTVPGVIGVICLALSGYGLLNLPTNWIGILLIVGGIVMFLLDIKVAGWALSLGGAVAFALGSLLLFTPPWVTVPVTETPVARLNPWLVAATTLALGAFFFLGVTAGIRAQFFPLAMGPETMLGKTGTVKRELTPGGIVHLDGEDWTAESSTGGSVPAGAKVRVVSVSGLTLVVEPLDTSRHERVVPPGPES